MAGLGSVSVTLGLDVKEFQKGLKTAESNLKSVGESMKATGEKMATALTVPLGAIGAVAISGAIEVQKSQGMIQAQLGVTGERAEELQGVVSNLFKEGLGGDMSEVQTAVSNVVRNMKELKGASDETISAVAKNSLNLAKAFDTDTKDITKSVNSMQQAFEGLDVEKSFDLITKGFQNGLDYSGEFLDSVNEYSVHFKEMGFSADEMFGFFNAGAEAGVFQLDKVGDLVKEMNIRLSDGTAAEYMHNFSGATQDLYKEFQKTGKGGVEVFQSIMKELGGMESESEAYQLGVALMGTQFEDLDMKAVTALANAKDGLDDATGSMDALNGAMNQDLGTVMASSFRKVQVALAPVGAELGKLAQEYLPPLIGKIEALANWFTGLSSKNQALVVSLGLLAAVFPVILIAIGSMISAVGAIAGSLTGLASVGGTVVSMFTKVKGAMNFAKILPLVTSPVGLIVLAIGGLIAAGVAIWKNWEEIKSYASSIWGAISDYFSGVWKTISSGVSSFLTDIGNWFTEKWESISKTTKKVFDAIVDFMVDWGMRIFKLTPIGLFVDLIVSNWDFIKETTSIIFEMILDIILAIWNKVVQLTKPILTAFLTFATDTWNKILSITKSVFNSVKDFFVSIWNSIVNFVKPILTSISNAVKAAWDKVSTTTSSIFSSVKNKVSEIWDAIYSKVKEVAGNIYTSVKEKFDSVKAAIVEPIEAAKEKVKKALDDIKGFFDNLKLKLDISLPSFSVSKGTTTFMGQEITVPKFDIDWNAKGAIFDGATVLGGNQGVGEAGAEAVLPIQHKRYMQPFSSSIAEHLSNMNGKSKAGDGGITQNITINSPTALSPSEIARKQLQASRKLAMEWR